MMNQRVWDSDPLSELERNIERMMDRFLSNEKKFAMAGSRVWRPPTDVFETTNHLVIKCELAGIRPKDVQIASKGKVVIISGNRQDVPHADMTNYYLMDILYGPFEVRIPLPITVNIEQAKARYEDGFLKILLPKAPVEKPGKILVKFEF